MISDRVVTIEDRFRISDLYAAYTACLDSGKFGDWPDFFTDDCTYRVVSRENYDRGLPLSLLSFESKRMLHDRVYGITETLFHEPYYQRHIVSLPGIELDHGAFRVEANYVVVRTKAGSPSELYNVGRYLDCIVDRDGHLLFEKKTCVYDSEIIPNSLIYPI
jgi:salicylate 5-hydroxylase small subunit